MSSTPGQRQTSRIATTPTSTRRAARWCASSGTRGWLRHMRRRNGFRRCLRRDRHARHLPDARDARPAFGPRRLRVRHAGAGLGRDLAAWHGGAEARVSAARRGGRGHRRVRACPSRTRAPTSPRSRARRAPTATLMCSTARRPGSPTAASPTSTWCSPAPAKRRGRAASAAFIVDAGTPRLRDRRAHRRDRAASARAAALHATAALPASQRSARRGRASSSRCARSTSFAPRSPRRRSASRAARSTRRWRARRAARCSARRSPTSSSRRRSSRRWRPTIDASALLTYRAAWQRDQGDNVTREAAMAKMAATEGAQRVIDAAVQIWGGARRRAAGSRSRRCTARSARCASTKARPKCSSSSSRASC